MSILPIVTYDDDMLRVETSEVQENSEQLQELIEDMFDTMYNANGVGLAAPQIGRKLRIFVTDDAALKGDQDEEDVLGPLALINPVITLESEETVVVEEGCLSIPDVRGDVTRPEKVTVTFRDRDFREQTLEVDGPLARIIQHELDHLNGVLFIDHLSYFKKKLVSKKLKQLAAGEYLPDYPVADKQMNN